MGDIAAILELLKGDRSSGDVKKKITNDFKKDQILDALLSCTKLIMSEVVWSACETSPAASVTPTGEAVGGREEKEAEKKKEDGKGK
jgi:hypothetical protein